MSDYSSSHSATFCACEIDNALGRNVITKIGHYSAIIDAHFPKADEIYRELALLVGDLERHAADLRHPRGANKRVVGASLAFHAERLRKLLPPQEQS
jgi:hypothetical protein